MDNNDKKEILDAIGAIAVHVDERVGGLEERMGSLTQEMRSGFTQVNTRLETLEESVLALSATFDKQLENNVLGKGNITLTRKEYDVFVAAHNLPNRYATSGRFKD